MNGTVFGAVNADVFEYMYKIHVHEGVSLFFIGFPVLFGVTMAMIQICLNLFIGNILSMAVIVGFDVLSAYVASPVLFGNLSILYRNPFVVKSELTVGIGVTVCFLLITMSAVISIYQFKKEDAL